MSLVVDGAVRVAGAVRVRVPLRRPLTTAHGTWPVCDAWLIRLMDADGRSGVGEASLGPFADAADQAALDGLARSHVTGGRGLGVAGEEGPAGAAVRAAIDGALLDLGRVLAERGRAATIPVNALIGAESLHASVAAARAAVAAGFTTIKLKGGMERTSGELAERLAAIRAAVGPAVRLRLDVNGAWDLPTAADRLRAIASVDLELVEQPIAAGPVEEVAGALARLRAATCVPIAADESVTSPAACRALLAAGAVDALVVKLSRVGGPRAALAIADEAAAAGVGVVVSTMLETGVGLVAGMATAAMLGGDRVWAHGLSTGDALASDLVGGRSVVAGGKAAVPVGPGLGLVMDHAAVERCAVETVGAWR